MIYSGNLNDFRDAMNRLTEEHDVILESETLRYNDPVRLRMVCDEVLRVNTRSGHRLAVRTFQQRDADERINAQTAWLRKVHSDLMHWK